MDSNLKESDSVGLFLGSVSWHVVTFSLFLVEEVLGSLVTGLELSSKAGFSGVSGLLGLLSVLGSLGLDNGGSLGLSILVLLGEDLSLLGGEWVKLLHHDLVVKWVLLGLVVDSDGSSDGSEGFLDLIGVDDSGQVSAGHEWSVHGVSDLVHGVLEVGSELVVQLVETAFGEHNQSSEMTTWGKLDDVKSANVAGIDTWEVLGHSLDIGGIVSVDDEWSLSQDVPGVSVFTGSGSHLLLSSDLVEVVSNSEVVEGLDEGFSVWDVEGVNNKRELWDVADLMTSGHDKWGNSGGSES